MTKKVDKELIKNPQELARYINSLQKKKLAIHQRIRAYSPDLGHDSRYGCWIDPFKFVSKTKRKTKTYEYY